MPRPETRELGRYLEDTITIDWQTPRVMECAKAILDGVKDPEDPEQRIRALFEFVRDEINHSLDVPTEAQTCRASEVLEEGTGLCFSKSHLLAGLLRFAGFPTGFCYLRCRRDGEADRFVLHGFNAVYWAPTKDWFFLDARGNRSTAPGQAAIETECRLTPPFSLAFWPDTERGEAFLPLIYKRPAKRIIDLLERAPSFDAVIQNLPDAI
ncbi:MAG: transglutaminase family protein [Myxococcota bacterium]